MCINNGLNNVSTLNTFYLHPVNNTRLIYGVINSSNEMHEKKHNNITLYHNHDSHQMAYSHYRHRVKKAAGDPIYSEAICQRSYRQLDRLLSATVANSSLWHRTSNRIKSLQKITKSDDCKAINR